MEMEMEMEIEIEIEIEILLLTFLVYSLCTTSCYCALAVYLWSTVVPLFHSYDVLCTCYMYSACTCSSTPS